VYGFILALDFFVWLAQKIYIVYEIGIVRALLRGILREINISN